MRVIIEKTMTNCLAGQRVTLLNNQGSFQPTAEKPFVIRFAYRFFTYGHVCRNRKGCEGWRNLFQARTHFNMDEYVGLPESHP